MCVYKYLWTGYLVYLIISEQICVFVAVDKTKWGWSWDSTTDLRISSQWPRQNLDLPVVLTWVQLTELVEFWIYKEHLQVFATDDTMLHCQLTRLTGRCNVCSWVHSVWRSELASPTRRRRRTTRWAASQIRFYTTSSGHCWLKYSWQCLCFNHFQ